jgi:hypothetical protein
MLNPIAFTPEKAASPILCKCIIGGLGAGPVCTCVVGGLGAGPISPCPYPQPR